MTFTPNQVQYYDAVVILPMHILSEIKVKQGKKIGRHYAISMFAGLVAFGVAASVQADWRVAPRNDAPENYEQATVSSSGKYYSHESPISHEDFSVGGNSFVRIYDRDTRIVCYKMNTGPVSCVQEKGDFLYSKYRDREQGQ
ncbi:hypothetical protein RYA05_02845 [Pseudomonas syringae pv. actinidiae]|nr:hypothetical protein [Pseudomonas syringae pv. actinidiae]